MIGACSPTLVRSSALRGRKGGKVSERRNEASERRNEASERTGLPLAELLSRLGDGVQELHRVLFVNFSLSNVIFDLGRGAAGVQPNLF
jgi:hypothetical protein